MKVRNGPKNAALLPLCKNRGFTLIEIMVAVVIMVVATSFLVVNLGQSNGKTLRLEARKLAMIINHGLDEAVLTGQVLGVQFNTSDKTYQFINITGNATAASGVGDEGVKDSFMRVRSIPESININLNLLEKKKKQKNRSGIELKSLNELFDSSILDKASNVFDDDANQPNNAIIIEPNGLINPFTLVLQSDKKSVTIELGDAGSAIVVDPENPG